MAYNETPTERIIEMSEKIETIRKMLQERPGYAYVTEDGKELYALVDDMMFVFLGENLNQKTDEEINEFIQNQFNKAMDSL